MFAFNKAGSNLGREDTHCDGTVDDADPLQVLFNCGSGCYTNRRAKVCKCVGFESPLTPTLSPLIKGGEGREWGDSARAAIRELCPRDW